MFSFKKKDKIKQDNFLLVGSPNVGKSTIFNRLTSSTNIVGNYDRTTVTASTGKFKKSKYLLTDLPGIYNLNASGEDEKVALRSIFNETYSGIINVVGANSFKRDLLLSIQLLESERPVTININMVDELNKKEILEKKLKIKLNCNINLSVARKNIGLENLKQEINCPIKGFKINYGEQVENKIKQITSMMTFSGLSKRFLAIQLLEKNPSAINLLKEKQEDCDEILNLIEPKDDLSDIIYIKRNEFINAVYEEVFVDSEDVNFNEKQISKKFDKLLLQKWFGLPVFVIALVGVYFITFGPYGGGFLKDKIDLLLNDIILVKIEEGLISINTPWFLTGFIVNGLLAGIFSVLPFLPFILILFFFVGIFQQSGYLARVSILTDRLLTPFGLSGRSVINLISGMGCNVPAIMMARSSVNKKEKWISIFIAPFISCSARAVVFSFVANLIFLKNAWLAVFLLQILSGVIALLVGLLFSKTMFRKNKNLFLIEIPKWRHPDLRTIGKLMLLETKTFLIRVTKFVLIGSMVVWLVAHIGPKGLLTDEQVQYSFIGYVGKGLSYLFVPMGLNDWRVVTSLILAFPAKELAVSNMIIIFNGTENIQAYFNLAKGVAFMVYFLIYIPCLTTMAITKKETNWKMVITNSCFSLLTAHILASIAYWISYPLN